MKKVSALLALCVVLLFVPLANVFAFTYTPIFNGNTLYGSIDSSFERDNYSFIGNTGDLADIFLFRTDNTGQNYGTLDPVVELWYGTTYLAMNDDSGGDSPVPGPWYNSLISNYQLPYDGEYTIVARGYSTSTGTYGLNLNGSGWQEQSGPNVVPEPATLSLIGLGLLGLFTRNKVKTIRRKGVK